MHLTPYLILVFVGFGSFAAVLGTVTAQGWFAAMRARRQAEIVEPVGRKASQAGQRRAQQA
jgi:hypothetical protein